MKYILIACLGLNALLPLFLGVEEPVAKPKVPPVVREFLDSDAELTVYSLEPLDESGSEYTSEVLKRLGKDNTLHDWKVLGKTIVKEPAERAKLLKALKKSVGQPGRQTKCFWPRHAVNAKIDGKAVDLMICFQCGWVYAWVDGEEIAEIETNLIAQQTLDDILTKAKVPLARKTRK